MAETVTLHLPDDLAQQAREVATLAHRPLEDVLVEWLGYALTVHASGPLGQRPIETLPDPEILALCDLQMPPDQQETLSSLLEQNRETELSEAGKTQLDTLMQVYRRGLVQKAKAWNVAVSRGLRPALG